MASCGGDGSAGDATAMIGGKRGGLGGYQGCGGEAKLNVVVHEGCTDTAAIPHRSSAIPREQGDKRQESEEAQDKDKKPQLN